MVEKGNEIHILEREFLEKIDCKFPYFDKKTAVDLIMEAITISDNAVFMIIHELVRIPHNIHCDKKIIFEFIDIIKENFKMPLFDIMFETIILLINGKDQTVKLANSLMNEIKYYPGQYAALAIIYFSCDDIKGVNEPLYQSIVQSWQ